MKVKKNMIRILVAILTLCLLIVIGIFCINLYMVKITEDKIVSSDSAGDIEPDCIIVLGAMVHSDGTPSSILKERLDKGIELYKDGASNKLLLSGNNGQNEYNEVIPMRNYAIEHGVPEKDIYIDYAGFSTYESMYRLRDIFEAESAIVVTQKYHLYRALYIGEKLDLNVLGVASANVDKDQWNRDLREILARVKSFGLVMMKSEPTYLGEPVPLSRPQNISE